MNIHRSIAISVVIPGLCLSLGSRPAPAAPPEVGVDSAQVRVFPNPWRADQHATSTITFDRLPVPSKVRIFTLSGREVRTLSAESGIAYWDRTNTAGDPVASGVYLFRVAGGPGGEIRGKLAIIK